MFNITTETYKTQGSTKKKRCEKMRKSENVKGEKKRQIVSSIQSADNREQQKANSILIKMPRSGGILVAKRVRVKKSTINSES